MKTTCAMLGALTAAFAAHATVTVSDVTFTQDAATHDVKVTYDLATSDNEPAFVSLDVLTNGVSVGATRVKTLSGDVSTTPADTASLVDPGEDRQIVWRARADLPGVGIDNATFRVTAIATNHFEGLYMVVDLSRGKDSTYWPVQYTACKPDTNSPAFYTTELWLRRVPAGTFAMGYGTSGDAAPVHNVTLTKDFYCGVVPVTVAQHRLIDALPANFTNDDTEHDRHPIVYTVYSSLRGTGWPNNKTVSSSSTVGKLRAKTSLAFELPTEAQWEYACRAGHSGNTYNEGTAYNNNYGALAWGQVNAGGTTHPVGQKKPSDWDFYDFYGNAYEWCRDWFGAYSAAAQVDPVGPTSNSNNQRVRRGGAFGSNESGCNSYYRNHGISGENYANSNNAGYRLVVETDEGDAAATAQGVQRGSVDSATGLLETRPGATLAGFRADSAESFIDTATDLAFVIVIR